jgi:CHAT domain-containing protein
MTGPLAFLPIHAAGCYGRVASQSKIFNYVISSYTPTLSALMVPEKSPEDFRGILAVSQEVTPNQIDLPYAAEELQKIHQLTGDLPLKKLEGADATVDAVLNAMEECSWVHLACHATQDTEHPTESAFFLSDGKLSLARIMERRLKHASLAFLSACQTAVGDEKFPEEAIHLASGMTMAGYPTVIGTMWSIKDKHAPLIAQRVYAELLKGGKPDTRLAAEALHKAVAELRQDVGEDKFEEWAPFIHIGL